MKQPVRYVLAFPYSLLNAIGQNLPGNKGINTIGISLSPVILTGMYVVDLPDGNIHYNSRFIKQ